MAELNIIGSRKIWFAFSGLLVALAVVCFFVFGLNLGIDFTGGSLLEMHVPGANTESVRATALTAGHEAVVVSSGTDNYLLRLPTLTPEQHDVVVTGIKTQYEGSSEVRFESVGPSVGEQLKKKTAKSVVLVLALIMAYVAWAFRRVSQPVASWKYGLVTILASIHDVIIPLGVFAVLGKYFGYQVDTGFVAAMLTILGYSINDTIVVLDRTRENLSVYRHSDLSFEQIVNKSVVQTFGRSINTSLTTLLTLSAVFVFGGETIKPFALALIIGIIAGTYSSIFIASPLLVVLEKKK